MLDRLSNGDQWTMEQVAVEVFKHFKNWRGIRICATIMAESGGWTWIRPMVLSPDSPAHLSTDRGIAQFNSYWWDHVTDGEAFDPVKAIGAMCQAIKDADSGADAFLASQWHGSKSDLFYQFLQPARAAINALRIEEGLAAI